MFSVADYIYHLRGLPYPSEEYIQMREKVTKTKRYISLI